MGWKMFDYECSDCEHIFEELVKDPDEKVMCKSCGSENVKKMLSAPDLGFLENDKERRMEVLKKRSREHTAKQQRVGNMPSLKDYE